MQILVGCVTRLPEPYDDRHFVMEMRGESLNENRIDELKTINIHYLIEDMQPITPEIIDDVTFIMDAVTKEMLYDDCD